MVGFDEAGDLAGVLFHEELGDEMLLSLAAVALAWRGQRLGDELMERFADRAIAYGEARGLERIAVTGNVHAENHASKQMLRRHHWAQWGSLDDKPDEYEVWGHEVDIPAELREA